MIKVHYKIGNEFITHEFDNDVSCKILACGALKVTQPVEIDVPPMGSKDEKDIAVEPEQTLALFHGKYIMEVEDYDNE